MHRNSRASLSNCRRTPVSSWLKPRTLRRLQRRMLSLRGPVERSLSQQRAPLVELAARLRFFITTNHSEEQFRTTIPLIVRELERLRAAAA